MGLFSRKGKSSKETSAADELKKSAIQTKVTKKFVPRHGSATVTNQDAREDNASDGQQTSVIESRRIEIPRHDGTFQRAAYARGSMTAPASPSGQRFQQDSGYGEDGYCNPAESIPMPPAFKERHSAYRPKYQHRSSSDYFAAGPAPRKHSTPGGYYTPHASSDSGYESAEPISAAHSRVPSELNLLDYSPSYLQLTQTMPELKLYTGEQSRERENSPKHKSIGNVSPLDLNSDSRSIRSNKSVSKRARFEDDAEPMPSLQALEQYKTSDELTSRPASLWLSNQDAESATPERHQAETRAQMEQPHPRRRQSSQSSTAHTSPVDPCQNRVGSLPPLSVLEGFKVNKKGKILDEEGDAIGELVEGDLLDCVRQKANANGEVIDEYGRVVGRVRTCAPAHAPANISAQQHIAVTSPAPATQDSPAVVERDVASTLESQPAAPLPSCAADPAPHVKDVQPHAEEAAAHDTPPVKPAEEIAEEPIIAEQKTLSHQMLQAAVPTQETKRMSRSASEKSLSELTKTYVRPTMSSVPENNVPEDESIPASPGLFAYRGEIPKTDGTPSIRRRSNSPPQISALSMPTPIAPGQLPNPAHYAKLALVGGFSNSTLHPPMRPTGANSRRTTTHFGGSVANGSRPPLPSALKKTQSHTYGFEIGPSGSESSSDDGRMLSMPHSRAASVITNTTVSSKPRTYFTHGGKVTVEVATKAAETAAPKPVAPPVPVEDKKKSRMSMSFRRKSKAAA
ncbi:hypothetical protein CKM354_000814700 [Cercospora kikuchii]|uniref:Uncharacterized protein n=1 Tax=Cercospora kikuchii TaxID=84275 RepID=A0A9P3CLJ2_9PEZI|nr:uncharacterized protein CKM354_000814700 [Cercospora kikuchii]GIZ44963.1 hypothetical protein CKM354_000814700 [Cercospora kikuchii]